MKPLFSIITITYNAAPCLPRTLDSLLGQTFRDIEHIIIDGASTDTTADIARAYADKAAWPVHITSEPDDGLYYAMNKGLLQARGRYVLFLNAGDSLAQTDTLETIASIADGQPAVIYGRTDITDADGHFLHHRRLTPPEKLTWRSFLHGMLVCHQAFYARTDIARRTLYDTRYRYSADIDWCIRIMKTAAREGLTLKGTDDIVALYTEEGQTTRHHQASLRERFRIMAHHYGLTATTAMHAWFVVRQMIKP